MGADLPTVAVGSTAPATVGVDVRLSGITKRFDALVANDHVDVHLRAGEVHAVLGENGAGKSTLMNILCGVLTPDSGTIMLNDRLVVIGSPKRAIALGIGMVHQHFRLFEALSVAENLHIGWRDTPRVYRGRNVLRERTRLVAQGYGLAISPQAAVWQLGVGEKQRVEIMRTLIRGAEILILDEPTAVLSPAEADGLFELLAALRRDNKTIVFISHKLPEVLTIADRITVMRGGKTVRTLLRSEADAPLLARLMVGGEVTKPARQPSVVGETILFTSDVSARDDRGLAALRSVSVEVRGGEIVGVAGVAGNGQREFAEVLTGLRRVTGGKVVVDQHDLSRGSARAFIEAGVGSVPEDRLGTGLAPSETIWRNAILKNYRASPVSRRGVLSRRRAKRYARRLAGDVRLSATNVDLPVRALSGGHAQRLLTGREMDLASRALVLTYPTRGLDIQAVENLRGAILDARSRGIATLLISEDLDELLELSDRVIVLYEGAIAGEFDVDDADHEKLASLMSGATDPRTVETGG